MIRSVMFDFGGVISSSPFEAFERYERANDLPVGFIRMVNSTDPDTNAWARLERGELDIDAFDLAFGEESARLGHPVGGRSVLAQLGGALRPAMVDAVRRCSQSFSTACLTNNFTVDDLTHSPEVLAVFDLFDQVLESRTLGVRKPDPRFYVLACEALSVDPHEVVYLDDLGINLKPARAMGMQTIKVTGAAQALTDLSAVTGLSFDV